MSLTPKQVTRLEKALVANLKKKEKRIEDYNANPSICKSCDAVFSYAKRHNKYCSHSCSARLNNRDKIKNYVDGSYSKKQCEICGEYTTNAKFCSKKCWKAFKLNQRLKHLQETGCLAGTPATVKKFLIKERGCKCEICGLTEWLGKLIPLVLDHINGKPSDWCISNVRLVCGNCNMQLPTFAGRNVGKGGGRPYRKLRYNQGKSW